jgi:hypothetical protein
MNTTKRPLKQVSQRQSALRLSHITPLALASSLLIQSIALAQTGSSTAPTGGSSYRGESTVPPLGTASQVFPGASNGGVDYRANAQVARLAVEVEKNDLPADGVSPNRIIIRAFDAEGQFIKSPKGKLFATIEVSAGRILVDGAKTDEFGPGRRDADRVIPGTQVELVNGAVAVTLLAPVEAQDVRVRVTMGSVVAQGVVSYLPELREFVAAGLLEGILTSRSKSNISPTRIDDGFEKELRRWVRNSDDGKRSLGVRSAFFVKGKLQNEWLLTAAFDSDKDSKNRLFKDPTSDEMYPVYGDSALRGNEAKSADRVYLRMDKGKTYGLYGDFNTGDGFSQLTGGGSVAGIKLRNLGSYSRSATGLRGHLEESNYLGNAYYFRDNLKQVVEEYRGNGTSGPYYVTSRSGVQGSEKVEIITRDRNQLGVVLDVLALVRFDDYTFEPFSGAILLKSPVASLDSNGNPRYLRITYEVEQGGPSFAAYGVDGQVKLAEKWEVGGSFNRDENPSSPYTLMSVNTAVQLGDNTRLVAEVARSKSTRYLLSASATTSTTTPSGAAGELRNDRTGDAVRIEVQHKKDALQGAAWLMTSDPDFYNPSASVSEGKSEYGAKAGYQISEKTQVYGEISRTQQKAAAADPARDAMALGVKWKPTETLALDLSLRQTQEDAGFTGGSTLSSNTSAGGGFFGLGNDGVNPSSGISNTSATTGTANTVDRNATSVRLGVNWAPAERWTLGGDVELGSESQRRFAVNAQYQLAERAKVFGRYEHQRGLTSSSALNPEDKSNALTFGVESGYMPGGTLFSEYRLRDALSGETASNRDMQLASGVRNTWNVREGLAYTTSAEILKVFQGSVRNAFALTGGVDYRMNELTQFSGRLEWRRLNDDVSVIGDQTENQYLSTVSVARKMDRDWTFLARNYLLVNDYTNGARIQDRLQFGAAWRPVDHNRFNALGRYEYKTQRDTRASATPEDSYNTHIISMHGSYHPSRPWWLGGRVAYKNSKGSFTNPDSSITQDNFSAILVGGRVTYDITENWDISYMASVFQGLKGDTGRQFASGLEVGYLLRQDLWLSAGYNWTGFSDKDLTSGEYTNRGAYLRLRFKFDENLFRSDNKSVNRALDR